MREERMSPDAMVSTAIGVRGARGDGLRRVSWLLLLLLLCAMGAQAQTDQPQPAAAKGSEAAGGPQRRVRRVAEENPEKKEEEGTAADEQTTGPATRTDASAGDGEADAQPPQPPSAAAAARQGDRLSMLRAQIKEAATVAERNRLRRTLVDYLVALNKKPEAVEELRAMAAEDRFDPVGFYNIGNALARLNESGAAVEAYRKAVSQRKGFYPRALNNLGVMLMRLKRWDEAEEALQQALKQEGNGYPEARSNLERLSALRAAADSNSVDQEKKNNAAASTEAQTPQP